MENELLHLAQGYLGAKRWHGVKISTSAQFFDTNVRWEIDSRSAFAGGEVRYRDAKIAVERIKQPFHVVWPHEADDHPSGSDLLDALRNDLRKSRSQDDRPTIHIVVGPAGIGKSVLFEMLYARLYDEFQADKRAQQLSSRPFALLSEYLEDAASTAIASLLEAYLRTEFAKRLDSDQFNWKLIHEIGNWLSDRLDGVLERDPGFFDDLEDLMTTPESVTTPSIDNLASTPYYCNLLLDGFAEDGEWTGESEIEILERGLTRLIAGERLAAHALSH